MSAAEAIAYDRRSPRVGTATRAVQLALAAIEAADRPEVWIALRCAPDLLAEAAALDARVAAGELLPLAGRTLAVKDNIDVAGLPTTAGCPAYAFAPERDAPVVARLRAAGAIVLGKTNLDQFATGLVGTRSPYGAVRDAWRPEHVSGGSSAGSGVAVALGLADLALGTDTAGSGRVPAAFGGIVGLKPSRGLVPNTGVVPACRTLDVVTVFAQDVTLAQEALAVMAGPEAADPVSRAFPADTPLAAPPAARVGVPDAAALVDLTPEAQAAFATAAERLTETGCTVVPLDPAPFIAAGKLLYEGAFVAERYAAVGAWIDAHPGEADPTVAGIITAAAAPAAHTLATDAERLDRLKREAAAVLADLDAILLPTTTRQPTLLDVHADPVGANSRLGVYTNCANLLDLCAIAIPAGEADGGRFGVSLMAPAFHDAVIGDLARRFTGDPDPVAQAQPAGTVALLVVGAHRAGQPLNRELTDLGARFDSVVSTAPQYELHRLDTTPPKPGLTRVATGGAAIEGERWLLSPAALGRFLAGLPGPMALGRVALEDGSTCVGFTCETAALDGAEDITAHGSWPAYLAARAT